MDYYCKHCSQPIEFDHMEDVDGRSIDVWVHVNYVPECSTPELLTPHNCGMGEFCTH